MPFIDVKTVKKLTDDQKDELKTRLGRAVSLIGKSEGYLMVGINDGYTLYFGGNKLDDGAFVSVNLFGASSSQAYSAMTGEICNILSDIIGTAGNKVYVTYGEFKNWGWNGSNF